ncbi:MAG TPA: SWIM zinc finger family protein, partial [Flavisolibacter sp.]
TSRLSAMGLLGYDVDENNFFYRQLPYKPERIMGLNPRLKEAGKLLEENKVEIVARNGDHIEARIKGSGVMHTVILDGELARCTCTWFARHQGERGHCKHILAAKKKAGQ